MSNLNSHNNSYNSSANRFDDDDENTTNKNTTTTTNTTAGNGDESPLDNISVPLSPIPHLVSHRLSTSTTHPTHPTYVSHPTHSSTPYIINKSYSTFSLEMSISPNASRSSSTTDKPPDRITCKPLSPIAAANDQVEYDKYDKPADKPVYKLLLPVSPSRSRRSSAVACSTVPSTPMSSTASSAQSSPGNSFYS